VAAPSWLAAAHRQAALEGHEDFPSRRVAAVEQLVEFLALPAASVERAQSTAALDAFVIVE